MIRQVATAGGFAAVLHKGEADAGTLLVLLTENGAPARLYERMPQADGARRWLCTRHQEDMGREDTGQEDMGQGAGAAALSAYLARRAAQDPDVWIIELDIADGERFILESDSAP